MPSIQKLRAELDGYVAVLLGREDPPDPIRGEHTESLMEYANTVYARGMEMTMVLQGLERSGHIARGSAHYKFRTGELRTFCDLAKSAAELGSRRITVARWAFDQSHSGDWQ
jgi:hypothetical protein